jgi:hypothetical protein
MSPITIHYGKDLSYYITILHPTNKRRIRPCKCCCCGAVFPSWQIAIDRHRYCYYWSCSFIPSANFAFYGYHDQKISCCFCNDLDTERQAEAWRSPEARIRHLEKHSFRMCNQQKFTDYNAFLNHLYEGHDLRRNPDSIEILVLRGAASRFYQSTFKPYDGRIPAQGEFPARPVATSAPQDRGHSRTKSRGSRVIEKFASAFSWSPRSPRS